MTTRFTLVLMSLVATACGRTATDEVAPKPDAGEPGPGQAGLPAIYAGGDDSCSLDSGGHVACWGYGTGKKEDSQHGADHFMPPEPAFRDLGMSETQICGVRADSTLRCWPDNWAVPTPPPGKFRQVSTAWEYGCGLDLEGHALCWGKSGLSPLVTKPPPDTYKAISCSDTYCCALRKADGHPLCWGSNKGGETSPPDEQLVSISAGAWHACGLRPNGSATCWGLAPPVPQGPLHAVVCRGGYACFIHPDQQLSCATASVPLQDSLILTQLPTGPFAQVALGSNHACGLRPDGSVVCWGKNDFGQATPPG